VNVIETFKVCEITVLLLHSVQDENVLNISGLYDDKEFTLAYWRNFTLPFLVCYFQHVTTFML